MPPVKVLFSKFLFPGMVLDLIRILTLYHMNLKALKTAVAAIFILISVPSAAQLDPTLSSPLNKFGQAIYYINQYYLDTVNNDKLIENAIREALSQLDPHSSYVSSDEVKAMNEPLEGNFEGVGIEFSIIRDTLTVVNPVSGGPSERVGIRAGDKIVAVNGEVIASTGVTNDKVFKYLRGPKGSKVMLKVIRRGVPVFLDFEVERDRIPINSIDAVYEPAKGIVYIKLSRFAATTRSEIMTALATLNIENPKGVILDLRGNSGGYLGTAFEISNMFLDKGQTIVYTEGRRIPKMVERANGEGIFKNEKLAVLIDEGSASASEIVAGAIQDWDRGVVLGRRSFGKGLVQQKLPLPDGSQLVLTIARYHTPSGRVIQSPYEQGSADKYYKAIYARYSNGEFFSKDSIHFPDSLKYKTLLKGRTVYGGGGIMPDIFIPADTTGYSDYYGSIVRRGILLDYMNDITDSGMDEWKRNFGTFEIFMSQYDSDNKIFDGLISYAETKGLAPVQDQIERSSKEIKLYMKAIAARRLFGQNAYYMVVNSSGDPVFERALKTLL